MIKIDHFQIEQLLNNSEQVDFKLTGITLNNKYLPIHDNSI